MPSWAATRRKRPPRDRARRADAARATAGRAAAGSATDGHCCMGLFAWTLLWTLLHGPCYVDPVAWTRGGRAIFDLSLSSSVVGLGGYILIVGVLNLPWNSHILICRDLPTI